MLHIYVVSNAPHSVEISPRTFPRSPKDASVQGEKLTRVRIKISPSTYNKPSSWEERETVIKSRLRQVRDRASWGVDLAGREGEEVGALENRDVVPPADRHVPCRILLD